MGNSNTYTLNFDAGKSFDKFLKKLNEAATTADNIGLSPENIERINDMTNRIEYLERLMNKMSNEKLNATQFVQYTKAIKAQIKVINDSFSETLKLFQKLGTGEDLKGLINNLKTIKTGTTESFNAYKDEEKKILQEIKKEQKAAPKIAEVSRGEKKSAQEVLNLTEQNVAAQQANNAAIKEGTEALKEQKKAQDDLNRSQDKAKHKTQPKGEEKKQEIPDLTGEIPEQKVMVTYELPDNITEELKVEIQKICDVVSDSNPTVKVQVAFVSSYKTRQNTEAINKMMTQLDEIMAAAPEDLKKILPDAIEGVRKELNHQLKSNKPEFMFDTNVQEISNHIITTMQALSEKLGKIDLHANVILDQAQIKEQLSQMKDLSLTIKDLTFDPSFIDAITNAENLLKEKAKIQKEGETELVTMDDEDKEQLETFMDKALKLKKLIQTIGSELKTIPLRAEFNKQQIQDALDLIDGLSVNIDKLTFNGLDKEIGGLTGIPVVYGGQPNGNGQYIAYTGGNIESRQISEANEEAVDSTKTLSEEEKTAAETVKHVSKEMEEFVARVDKAAESLLFTNEGKIKQTRENQKAFNEFVRGFREPKSGHTLLDWAMNTKMLGEGQTRRDNIKILQEGMWDWKENTYVGGLTRYAKANNVRRPEEIAKELLAKDSNGEYKYLKKDGGLKKRFPKENAQYKKESEAIITELFQSMVMYGVNTKSSSSFSRMLPKALLQAAGLPEDIGLDAFSKYTKDEEIKKLSLTNSPEAVAKMKSNRKTLAELEERFRKEYPVYSAVMYDTQLPTTPQKTPSKKKVEIDEKMANGVLKKITLIDELETLAGQLYDEGQKKVTIQDLEKEKRVADAKAKLAEKKSEQEDKEQESKKTFAQIDEESVEKGETYEENKEKRIDLHNEIKNDEKLLEQAQTFHRMFSRLTEAEADIVKQGMADGTLPKLANYLKTWDEESQKRLWEKQSGEAKGKFDRLFNKIEKDDKGRFTNVTSNFQAIDDYIDYLMVSYPNIEDGKLQNLDEIKNRKLKKNDLAQLQRRYEDKTLIQSINPMIDTLLEKYDSEDAEELNQYIAGQEASITQNVDKLISAIDLDKKGEIVQSQRNVEMLDKLLELLELSEQSTDIKAIGEKRGLSKAIVGGLSERLDAAMQSPQMQKWASELKAKQAARNVRKKTDKERKKEERERQKAKQKELQQDKKDTQETLKQIAERTLPDSDEGGKNALYYGAISASAQKVNRTGTIPEYLTGEDRDKAELKAINEKIANIEELKNSMERFRNVAQQYLDEGVELSDSDILKETFMFSENTYSITMRNLWQYEELIKRKNAIEENLAKSEKKTQTTAKKTVPVTQLSEEFKKSVETTLGGLSLDDAGNIKETEANKKKVQTLINKVRKEYKNEPFNLKSLETAIPKLGEDTVEEISSLRALRRDLDAQADKITSQMKLVDKDRNPDEWNKLNDERQKLYTQIEDINQKVANPYAARQEKADNFFNSLVKMYSQQSGVAENMLLGEMADLGKNTVDGYTKAVKEKTPDVAKTMEDSMQAGVDASAEQLEIHSPSYVYYQLGYLAVEGYLEGVMANLPKLKELMSKITFGKDGLIDKASAGAYKDLQDYVLSNGGTDIRLLKNGENTDSRYSRVPIMLYNPSLLKQLGNNLSRENGLISGRGNGYQAMEELYKTWSLMAPNPLDDKALDVLIKDLGIDKRTKQGKENANRIKTIFKYMSQAQQKNTESLIQECIKAAEEFKQENDPTSQESYIDLEMKRIYNDKSKSTASTIKNTEKEYEKRRADVLKRWEQKTKNNQNLRQSLFDIATGEQYTESYRREAITVLQDAMDSGRLNIGKAKGLLGKDSSEVLLGDANVLEKRINEINQLLAEVHLPDEARRNLEVVLQKMEELRESTDMSRKAVSELNAEFEVTKSGIDTKAIKYSKDLQRIIDDSVKGDRSRYMPAYIQKAMEWQSAVRSGTYDVNGLNSFFNEGNLLSNLRGNRTNLQNYISKGESMLATNYLPGGIQSELKNVITDMRTLAQQTDVSKESIDRLTNAFREVEMEAAKAGKTFVGQIGQRLKDMNAKFIAQYLSIHDLIRYFRSMISTITELDTALTEMRKVSDESIASLKEYQKTTFDTASTLGTTAVQLQQSTADWLRLGESMDEAKKSAVAATTLLNVSEFENINEATEALVSMSQAYKDLDKTEIIDVLNNIGNNYSIATDKLATALQASSAALVTQGNDLYEAAALVTAGNAIIQDASKVGTGIRTISLRIAGMKLGKEELEAELDELGEEVDAWVVSTESKKREVIKKYTATADNPEGVDILDSNGNLKDTYHIMLEISKVYAKIQEEDKKYGTNRAQALVEELAGKVRSNIAASILMNPDLLENVYNSAIDSAGSAAEENAKYLDSIVGKTQQLKNELQELEQYAFNSETWKDVLDFGTTALSLLNESEEKLPIVIGLLGSLAMALVGIKKPLATVVSFNQATGMFNTSKSLSGKLGGKLATSVASKNMTYGYMDVVNGQDVFRTLAFNDTTKNELNSILSSAGYKQFLDVNRNKLGFKIEDSLKNYYALNKANLDISKDTQIAIDKGIYSMESYAEAERVAAQEAKAAASSAAVLNSVLTTGITIAVTVVISLLVKKLKDLATASEDASRSASEFVSVLHSAKEQIKSNSEYIEEIAEDFVQLAKGVDEAGKNIKLSADDYAKYNEITEELANRFPEMIQYWDDNGKAILKNVDSIEALNEAYKENRELTLQKVLTDEDNGPSALFKNFKEINKANLIEGIVAEFTHNKKAGVRYDYKDLKESYETFLKLSYSDFQSLYGYGEDNFEGFTNFDRLAVSRLLADTESKHDKKKSILGISRQATEEEFNAARIEAQALYSEMKSEMDELISQFQELGDVYLELNPDYEKLDEESRKVAKILVSSLDEATIESFENNPIKFSTWVAKSLETIQAIEVPVNELFKISDDKKSLSETRKEMQKVWEETFEAYDELIEQNAGNKTEQDRLIKQRNDLYANSELKNIEDLYRITRNSLSAIGKTNSDYAYLEEQTKDFTEANWELWLTVTNGAMSATEALRRYQEELAKQNNATKYSNIGALFSQDGFVSEGTQKRYELLQSQGATDQIQELKEQEDTWADVRDELIGMFQTGKLDEDTLKSYKYFDEIIKALGIDADTTDDAIKEMLKSIETMSLGNAIDQLDSYKQGIDHLDNAYQQYKKGKLIDASMLNDIQSTFGKLDAYDDFEKAVLSGEKNLQQYFDAIVNEYAKQETALGNLTEENKTWVEQQLVASGITKKSAHDTIESILAEQRALEGKVKATIDEMNATAELDNANRQYVVSTEKVNDVTAQQVVNLIKAVNGIDAETTAEYNAATALELEKVALNDAQQAVVYFTLKKELAKDASLRNEDDINYLLQLINLADLGAQAIDRMKKLMINYNSYKGQLETAIENRNKFLEGKDQTKLNSQDTFLLGQLNSEVEKYSNLIGEVDDFNDEMTKRLEEQNSQYNYGANLKMAYGGAIDSNKQAAEDALQKAKETLDKILAMYDAELDAGVVSFQTYVDKSRAIIQQYYDQGKIKAQDYYDYLANLYEKQVNQYDKVISAVQKKIQDETDALEKQKENVEKSYNDQIEVIQKKIDALQEENDEIDRNMELSKAQ